MYAIPIARNFAAILAILPPFCSTSPGARADCEDVLARHMVGEALLAAHLVAQAEKAGMQPAQLDAILQSISNNSAVEEFWITDFLRSCLLDQHWS